MASTIDNKKKLTTQAAPNAAPAAAAEAPQTAQSAAGAYTGLSGLSEQTRQKVGEYAQGYRPSDAVNAAQQYLQNVVSGKPGDYQSQYKGQLESLYNQVMNRKPFTFDLNGDALYNQYKDQYTQLGKQAMMDTIGQASAMTGGYGNSYAQTAGQQAYQSYLTQLNNIVPELYDAAFNRYNQEGADLQNQLAITQGLEDSAYGKYRDAVSDWNNERAFASDDYWNRYNSEYSDYANMLNYWNTIAQQENSQYNTNRELAYNQAMAILSKGKMPSSDLLAAAGISEADAKALKKSSGSSKSSSGGGTYQPQTSTEEPETLSYGQLSATAKAILNASAGGSGYGHTPTKDEIRNLVANKLYGGAITKAEADYILTKRGMPR